MQQVPPTNVFLIHGRDSRAVLDLRALLRAAGLNPIEWEEAAAWTGTSTPFTLDIVRAGFANAQAAIVLFTGDDTAKLREDLVPPGDPHGEGAQGQQPRPNVLVEAGMALALYPDQTIILQIGHLRPITDLEGLNTIRFDSSPAKRLALLNRLKTAGCECREAGADYMNTGFGWLSTP